MISLFDEVGETYEVGELYEISKKKCHGKTKSVWQM
jgi:hypothetical protein